MHQLCGGKISALGYELTIFDTFLSHSWNSIQTQRLTGIFHSNFRQFSFSNNRWKIDISTLQVFETKNQQNPSASSENRFSIFHLAASDFAISLEFLSILSFTTIEILRVTFNESISIVSRGKS